MLKKVVLIALSIVFAFALSACGTPYGDEDLDEYIKVADYKGLEVDGYKIEVTDKEVNEEIQTRRNAAAETKSVTEGKVEDGDTIVISFEGTMDGKKFDGGSATDYSLTIGSGAMIPGFEEGLIGAEVGGDPVTLDLTFPKDYTNSEVAGKKAQFKVTVTSKEVNEVPDLDEDFIKAQGSSAKSVKEYKKEVRDEIYKQKETEAIDNQKSVLWAKVVESSEVKKGQVTSGTVVAGDTIVISYDATVDGKEFKGCSAEDQELTLGKGDMPKEFEAALIGKAVGGDEPVEVKITLAKDYKDKKVAGKEAVYKVTIKSKLDELYPEEKLQAKCDEMIEQYKEYAEQSGMSYEEFIKTSMGIEVEDFEAQVRDYSKVLVKQEEVLYYIVEKEDISISGEEYDKFIADTLETYGYDEESFEQYVGESYEDYMGGKDAIKEQIYVDKVCTLILDNAKVKEVK